MAESKYRRLFWKFHICDCVFHCIAIASGYSHFLCTGKIPFCGQQTDLCHLYGMYFSAGYLPFCIFTLQGFMSAVPRDYEESARIDGATNIQLLSRVMVPLAKPGIATITMLSAMGFWNEYPLALVLLTEDAKKTLPIGMANLFEVQKYATDWGALFAGLVIIMIPTIIIYLIGQRYLLQGIGAGGLKG